MGLFDKWKKKTEDEIFPGIQEEREEQDAQDKVLQQDLSQEADSERKMFFIWLLFDHEPAIPETDTLKAALTETFGDIDVVSDKGLHSFAVKKYLSHFKEGDIPAQVLLSDVMPYKTDLISEFERTQLWDVKDVAGLLEGLTHQVFVSDMMALLPYQERSEMLMDWMETALRLFPDCKAVWVPTAGKLFTAEQVKSHNISREDRFIYFAVNARFFNIQGGNDMVVDTLGMYAMGLPDVQYHYHTLDPNAVVNHAYNVATYLFQNDVPIKSGETIDGIVDGRMSGAVQWKCQYENSLIQPVRDVLDICAGEYAAGSRE